MPFKRLTDDFWASPQIAIEDVAAAAAQGVTLIVNNRPDDEEPGQPPSAEVEAAARAAGMDYAHIPVSHAGFSMPQVDAMADTLERSEGPVLGFCRSGTRSTLLWAMAEAKRGKDIEEIAMAAERGGYNVGAVAGTMDALAAESRG